MRGRSGRCCGSSVGTVRSGCGPGAAVGAAVASLPTVACLRCFVFSAWPFQFLVRGLRRVNEISSAEARNIGVWRELETNWPGGI